MISDPPTNLQCFPSPQMATENAGSLPPGDFDRITDAGDERITDAGDQRITA